MSDNAQQIYTSIYDHTNEAYGHGDDCDDPVISRCWFFADLLIDRRHY